MNPSQLLLGGSDLLSGVFDSKDRGSTLMLSFLSFRSVAISLC